MVLAEPFGFCHTQDFRFILIFFPRSVNKDFDSIWDLWALAVQNNTTCPRWLGGMQLFSLETFCWQRNFLSVDTGGGRRWPIFHLQALVCFFFSVSFLLPGMMHTVECRETVTPERRHGTLPGLQANKLTELPSYPQCNHHEKNMRRVSCQHFFFVLFCFFSAALHEHISTIGLFWLAQRHTAGGGNEIWSGKTHRAQVQRPGGDSSGGVMMIFLLWVIKVIAGDIEIQNNQYFK